MSSFRVDTPPETALAESPGVHLERHRLERQRDALRARSQALFDQIEQKKAEIGKLREEGLRTQGAIDMLNSLLNPGGNGRV